MRMMSGWLRWWWWFYGSRSVGYLKPWRINCSSIDALSVQLSALLKLRQCRVARHLKTSINECDIRREGRANLVAVNFHSVTQR